MTYFPQHKTLFIHIPKNAGRSIEIALLGDKRDLINQRRTFSNRLAKALLQKTASNETTEFLHGSLDYTLAVQHTTFAEIKSLGLLNRSELESSHKFAVVRNPFDRAVSSVMHFTADMRPINSEQFEDPKVEFERRLRKWLEHATHDHNRIAHRRPQVEYLWDLDGTIAVDNVIRYEQLSDDFEKLKRVIGADDAALPWFGKSDRARDYSEFYNDDSRLMIEKEFALDISEFQYEF